jgi:hypothetical protein
LLCCPIIWLIPRTMQYVSNQRNRVSQKRQVQHHYPLNTILDSRARKAIYSALD